MSPLNSEERWPGRVWGGLDDGSYDVEVLQKLHQFQQWNVVS